MLRRALVALLLLSPASAWAGGLSLPEPSIAALGRGGTGTAMPSGPAGMFYNPASLTFGRGLAVEAGILLEHERSAATPTGGAAIRSDATLATPALFISQRLGDYFAMGVGLTRGPSQRVDYNAAQIGSSQVQRASFDSLQFSPTVAGRPFPFLSIGFGLNVTFGSLDLVQAAGAAGNQTRAALSGTAVGIGGSIGVWARLYREYLSLGLAYRSAVDLDYTGNATLTAASVTKLGARLTLRMPHVVTLALGSQPRPGTFVQLEARVALLRDLNGFVASTTSDPATTVVSIPVALAEQWQLRAGAEQRLLDDRLAVRIGVGYDLGAARRDLSSAFPDGDRVVLSAGLGYLSPTLGVDVGYMASFSPSATANRGYANPAEYSSVRHMVGASLTVRVPHFGAQPTWKD